MPFCISCGKIFQHIPQRRKTTHCSHACANKRLRSNYTADNAAEWFWRKTIELPSGCLEWTGEVKDNGYGVVYGAFGILKRHYAHRVSFRLSFGSDACGVVRHKCDNKVCVNPEHLEDGSIADNVRDMVQRGQIARGERSGSAKLNAAQVAEIRGSADSHKEAALRYGVSDSTICRIRSRKIWRD